jgi:DnaA family protein
VIKQLALDIRLRDDATFANYVGKANLALNVEDNWTYIWGKPGSGKSHLLQAICHAHKDAIYLADLKMLSSEVLEDLSSISTICIDDIQDVLQDKQWEEALFHLLNAVKDQHKRLFVSADKPVQLLPFSLADLRSRLISATAIETDDLSDEQKLQVLTQRAHNRGFRLTDEVGRYILSRSSRDMRQLLSLLKQLEVETLRQGKRVTIPFVKQTLSL